MRTHAWLGVLRQWRRRLQPLALEGEAIPTFDGGGGAFDVSISDDRERVPRGKGYRLGHTSGSKASAVVPSALYAGCQA